MARAIVNRPEESDYKPIDKEAPIPAAPAPAQDTAPVKAVQVVSKASVQKPVEVNTDVELSDNVRAPSKPSVVKQKIDSAVDSVKRVVQGNPAAQNKPSRNSMMRLRDVESRDAQGMRGVKRYRADIRDIVFPSIARIALKGQGVDTLSPDGQLLVDRLVEALSEEKTVIGFKVSKKTQTAIVRMGGLDELIAYTMGRPVASAQERIVDLYLDHPTLADILLLAVGIGKTAMHLADVAAVELVKNRESSAPTAEAVPEPVTTSAVSGDA